MLGKLKEMHELKKSARGRKFTSALYLAPRRMKLDLGQPEIFVDHTAVIFISVISVENLSFFYKILRLYHSSSQSNY